MEHDQQAKGNLWIRSTTHKLNSKDCIFLSYIQNHTGCFKGQVKIFLSVVAVSLLRDSSTRTQEMYLEGINDFLENYCILPEEKHRNCQLIQPFQKFKKQSNLLPLIFFTPLLLYVHSCFLSVSQYHRIMLQ